MKIRTTLLAAAALATGLGFAAAPATAQGIQIGPGGVRVDPGYGGGGRGGDLSRGEVVRIARREGIVDVEDVGRRGPRFVVRGSDRRGDDITVVVDGRTGDVVDVRR